MKWLRTHCFLFKIICSTRAGSMYFIHYHIMTVWHSRCSKRSYWTNDKSTDTTFPFQLTLSAALPMTVPHQNHPEKRIKINHTWLGLTPDLGNQWVRGDAKNLHQQALQHRFKVKITGPQSKLLDASIHVLAFPLPTPHFPTQGLSQVLPHSISAYSNTDSFPWGPDYMMCPPQKPSWITECLTGTGLSAHQVNEWMKKGEWRIILPVR